MIKSFVILAIMICGSIACANDTMYYIQPAPQIVYYQAPTVSVVPVLVQKNFVVNTWEFRPIVTPNFVSIQYYYQPAPVVYTRRCCMVPNGYYYNNGSLVSIYRY